MIMSVCLDTFFSIFYRDSILIKLFNYFWINWYTMISDYKARWYFLIVFIKLDNVKLIQKLNQVCFLISPIVNLFVGSTFKIFLIKSLASP